MMLRGLRVDQGRRMKKIREWEAKILRVEWGLDELRKAVEYPARLNPQSPAQLQDFFYGHLCIPEIRLGFKGQRRLQQIAKLLKRCGVTLGRYRLSIISSNYVILRLSLQCSEQEWTAIRRLRTSYGVAGTETGRWSSRRNVFGTGGNLQNQHPSVKEIIVADPGYKLVYVDLEQAESRAVGLDLLAALWRARLSRRV
jgi:DNA polymerase I-like protein with 3'-5' exonuclease and polymerase domains